jgi:hypothetical protein
MIVTFLSFKVELTCGDTVTQNVSYFISPKFPAFMPFSKDKDSCKLKIKTVNNDVAQLRLDFVHFSLVTIDNKIMMNELLIS